MTLQRYINPADIMLPPMFAIDVYIDNLTCPIDMEFSVDGSLFIADAGVADGDGKILRVHDGTIDVFARGFNPPLTGITLYNNGLYVSHRGFITVLRPDGSRANVLEGLPSLGDHHNNKVEFGADAGCISDRAPQQIRESSASTTVGSKNTPHSTITPRSL